MKKEELKEQIRQVIKTNGQGAITGQILQDVLVSMIDEIHPIMYARTIPTGYEITPQQLINNYGWPSDFIEHFAVGQEYAAIVFNEGRDTMIHRSTVESGSGAFTFEYSLGDEAYSMKLLPGNNITISKEPVSSVLVVNEFPVNTPLTTEEFMSYGFPEDFEQRMQKLQYRGIKVLGEHSSYFIISFVGMDRNLYSVFDGPDDRYTIKRLGSSVFQIDKETIRNTKIIDYEDLNDELITKIQASPGDYIIRLEYQGNVYCCTFKNNSSIYNYTYSYEDISKENSVAKVTKVLVSMDYLGHHAYSVSEFELPLTTESTPWLLDLGSVDIPTGNVVTQTQLDAIGLTESAINKILSGETTHVKIGSKLYQCVGVIDSTGFDKAFDLFWGEPNSAVDIVWDNFKRYRFGVSNVTDDWDVELEEL